MGDRWKASTGCALRHVRGLHNDRCRDCTRPTGTRDREACGAQKAYDQAPGYSISAT
jgi:hypothetical protein